MAQVLLILSVLLFTLAWVCLGLCGFHSIFPESAASVMLGISLLAISMLHIALAIVSAKVSLCLRMSRAYYLHHAT